MEKTTIPKTNQTVQEQTQQEDQALQDPSKQKQEPLSPQARERGAIVLEVLAGTIPLSEAAESLGINPPAYYNLETRALQGLVRACEARPRGPGTNYKKQIRELEETNRKLAREARRYQSLTRAAQKAIGVMQIESPSKSSKSTSTSKPPKKRTPKKVRAQRAAERLRGKKRKSKVKSMQSLQKAGAE